MTRVRRSGGSQAAPACLVLPERVQLGGCGLAADIAGGDAGAFVGLPFVAGDRSVGMDGALCGSQQGIGSEAGLGREGAGAVTSGEGAASLPVSVFAGSADSCGCVAGGGGPGVSVGGAPCDAGGGAAIVSGCVAAVSWFCGAGCGRMYLRMITPAIASTSATTPIDKITLRTTWLGSGGRIGRSASIFI